MNKEVVKPRAIKSTEASDESHGQTLSDYSPGIAGDEQKKADMNLE